MTKYGLYLVCREHIGDVKAFLSNFFEERKGKYNHESWVTFTIPGTAFVVNLMRGEDQSMTQSMTFEIYCDSLKQLEEFAEKYKSKIESFVATKAAQQYRYHYIEIPGPHDICKIEVSFCEDI